MSAGSSCGTPCSIGNVCLTDLWRALFKSAWGLVVAVPCLAAAATEVDLARVQHHLVSQTMYGSNAGFAAVLACIAAVLVTTWLFVSTRKRSSSLAGGPQSQEKLRVFAGWAQQQIEESCREAHRQIMDDVIFTFAAYAQRLEKESSRAQRRVAMMRLSVLIELLETPSVNVALRRVNWEWLRDWEHGRLEPRDARLRCTVVLPTICAAARAQGLERHGRAGGAASETSCDRLEGSIRYLAGWCADFLERPDVCAFLKAGCEHQGAAVAGEHPGFQSAGALESESSDEEEDIERSVSVGTIRSDSGECDADDGVRYEDFSRRKFDGQEHCWDAPDATETLVRGRMALADYLSDSRKIRSQSSMLDLVDVHLMKSREEVVFYSQSSKSRIKSLRKAGDSRFFFVLNFRLPPVHLCITWAVPEDCAWSRRPEGVLFERFLRMSDKERNLRVKVLPKVTEGPWLVKTGMPDRPGIVGKKVDIVHNSGPSHTEMSVNCISSSTGRRIVNLLTGAAKHFSLELYLIIEGQRQDELPERILGGLSIHQGDLLKIQME
ncbi:unnamed protein product [Prorocentrum cordatum]|uniref:Protein ENHANCED DISEASE RESISTANCE 2 C-terminal domain-containing protein n=1 Tax=Prorocentrum cordatum TaxID=2364126 RepID=A0ABN9Q2B1_9DINO|nr:unnamed protein product [Polarella glacialis]